MCVRITSLRCCVGSSIDWREIDRIDVILINKENRIGKTHEKDRLRCVDYCLEER